MPPGSSGEIDLIMNDRIPDFFYSDNSGSITVDVRVCGGEGEGEGEGECELDGDGGSVIAHTADDVCLQVSNACLAIDGDFSWTYTPEGGSTPTLLPDATDSELCIAGVRIADSGTYVANFDNGRAKAAATYTVVLRGCVKTSRSNGLGLFSLVDVWCSSILRETHGLEC